MVNNPDDRGCFLQSFVRLIKCYLTYLMKNSQFSKNFGFYQGLKKCTFLVGGDLKTIAPL